MNAVSANVPTMARIHRERILLVGGQRALVMQMAHPKVAAGVAHHSDFPARALERLRRTIALTLATVYGTPSEAREAVETIRAVHDRVTGRTPQAGPYRANDPELLQWVNATLIDTTMVVYRRFVHPLDDERWRLYYDEATAAAGMFGISDAVIPRDLEGFRRYMEDVLDGTELRPTDEGHRVVGDVLRPPLPMPLRPAAAAARILTLALLPERVRDMFGLRAGPGARAALGAASGASRALLPLVPRGIREFPQARGRAEVAA